ncbi:siroheme synthase CysG [Halorhodospira neutriphila]|uniref:Siroheme synthase n=1 Tax=Halorhodospira neutriphila TaxID=168379 RepID=A0ABS1E6Y4_9GAMM|nr:siroheme synthase CysG [Halorhodospira neutriphila]MBK1726054.1 uroporphyrinogen-III C-methyltransferase [Halorhodospira neutriphila]
MHHFPIFLKLHGRPCLVIGATAAAAEKAGDLLRAGAQVTLAAPALGAECAALLERHPDTVHHHAAGYRPGLEQGMALVISASGDPETDRAAHAACSERGIPVNVVDNPQLCTYITPAVVDRSPLQVAITSGGAAPVLARQIRSQVETLLPPAYRRLAALAGRLRERVKAALPSPERRLRFWEQVFEGPAAESVLAGRERQGEAEILQALQRERRQPGPQGEVFLVGAGPGNPELLTFRALRLMQRADVVLYDHLAAPALLELVRKDAERIPVGKRRGEHTLPQERINERLIELAAAGKRVLRLKGGDPFVFGRGGEEIEGLIEHGVPFQIVPGVTAAQGTAAYSGIPLTHRDYAQSCRFLTGHRRNGALALEQWAPFHRDETLVVYMGVANLEGVCAELQAHELPAAHPAALVEQATTPAQQIVIGTLATLPQRVRERGLEGPALVVVGPTVALQPHLAWYQSAPDAERAFPRHGCLRRDPLVSPGG